MSLDRSIRWRGLDPVTIEHCHVISTARDTRIRSTIITPNYGLFYRIKLDDAERVRTVKLERTDGAVLELFSDGAGNWSDDRAEPLPALRGCVDIDIWPTPLTIPCRSGAANGLSANRSVSPWPGSTVTK
jgi:hypothetical protein